MNDFETLKEQAADMGFLLTRDRGSGYRLLPDAYAPVGSRIVNPNRDHSKTMTFADLDAVQRRLEDHAGDSE